MDDLGERRRRFTKYLVMLLTRMLEKNYQPMVGRDGLKHMTGSLHFDGLAIDIDLCDKNGKYLKDTEAHRQFGEYWESLDPDCFWGGDGPKEDGLKHDGNHYSLTYLGKK